MSQASTFDSVPLAEVPSPITGWRRLISDMAAVGGATLLCQALAVVTSLVLRAALSPAQMGVWQGLKLLLGYANYANLGVSKGAARELAIAVGSGQTVQAERGVNLAYTVNTLTSVLYGACLAATAFWLGRDGGLFESAWSMGLLALAVLVVLQRHVTFHVTVLRCRQAFTLTSWVSLIEGLCTLALAGGAAWLWGLPGLYGGTLLTLLTAMIFLRSQGVRPFAYDWQWTQIKRLVAIGGPILLCGVVTTLFQSLDKLIILSFSPTREFDLGCYSTTLMITGQVYGLANMFALVIAPRYGELFGRTGSRREVAQLAARGSELLVTATSLTAAVGLTLAVPLLGRLFPDYRPGLLPALWLVPGIVLLALALPLNQYLVAVCRERAALAASLVALVVAAAGDYLAIKLGYGIQGVAASTAVVYGGFYLFVLSISLWPQLPAAARRRYLLTHIIMLFSPIVPALWLTDVCTEQMNVARLAANMLIVSAAWGLATLIVWRHGEWARALTSRHATPYTHKFKP